MFIDLGKLKKEPLKKFKFVFKEKMKALEWLTEEDKYDGQNEVEVNIEAYYSDAMIFLSGSMNTIYTVECCRCLELYEKSAVIAFKDQLSIANSESGRGEAKLMTGEGDFEENYLITGDTLDLREYFRQIFVTSQDLKPLCKEECMGICSICGADRNVVKCSCKTDTVDLRLAGLKELKITLNENNRRN